MTKLDTPPDWIAVDWGTTHCRAWAMAGAEPLAQVQTARGMGDLAPAEFEPVLVELLEDWPLAPETPVVACGMVGARQGWIEATYTAVPCAPAAARPTRAPTKDPRLSVHILPGLSQDRPADVMRGEETQIAGFLALNPDFDGVICLPGSHTKWVQISAAEVVAFQTAMTGELFKALSSHSVLRHSVLAEGWDDGAFLTALDDALSKPEALAARLFSLRAEGLLHGMENATARARLSGLLIGAELAASRPYWLGCQVVLIGDAALCRLYTAALSRQGITPIQTKGDAMTRAGLTAAYRRLKETVA